MTNDDLPAPDCPTSMLVSPRSPSTSGARSRSRAAGAGTGSTLARSPALFRKITPLDEKEAEFLKNNASLSEDAKKKAHDIHKNLTGAKKTPDESVKFLEDSLKLFDVKHAEHLLDLALAALAGGKDGRQSPRTAQGS